MTRSEMVAAVKRLFIAAGSEEELHALRQQLKTAVPHANISDLIYYPDEDRDEEQIVDEALRREEEYAASAASTLGNRGVG